MRGAAQRAARRALGSWSQLQSHGRQSISSSLARPAFPVIARGLATSGKGKGKDKGKAPEDFYDESVEKEKEFLDVATVLATTQGGLESLTTSSESVTWKELDEAADKPIISLDGARRDAKDPQASSAADADIDAEVETFEGTGAYGIVTEAFSNNDLAEQLEGVYPKTIVPEDFLNYTVPWRKELEFPHEMLDKFVPRSSKELYRHDAEGDRSCTGKLQRKGKAGELKCHIIDLDEINHLDVLTLRRFLSDDGEILGKKQTGLCSKCQRVVAKTIKRSRNFGIVPHLSEYVVSDSKPLSKPKEMFHESKPGGIHLARSILK